MEKKDLKKRKSSFKYGRRRSRSLGGRLCTGICETIDKTLEPAERLKLLIEYSLKEALTVAEQEICSNLQPADFNEKTLELQCKIDAEIKAQDLYSLSITGEESIKESTSSTNILQFNEAVSKVEKESMQWDELISNERERLNKMPKENKTPIVYKGPFDISKYEKMNYSDIIDDISYAAGNYNYQVEKLKHFNSKLSKCTEITHKVTKKLNKEASEMFTTKIVSTPRTLMKRLYCPK